MERRARVHSGLITSKNLQSKSSVKTNFPDGTQQQPHETAVKLFTENDKEKNATFSCESYPVHQMTDMHRNRTDAYKLPC
jgi:hypothetical protein